MGEGMVSFVHFRPGAPSVNRIKQKGSTLLSNVAFRGSAGYDPVGAAVYGLKFYLSKGE